MRGPDPLPLREVMRDEVDCLVFSRIARLNVPARAGLRLHAPPPTFCFTTWQLPGSRRRNCRLRHQCL